MGLRGLDVCTGCGPGAMKGPMKGATIGHAKQRINLGRYIGLTEPGIIAAEPPNPIVNQLVIMPDIEKRLEAFVRMAHGIVVFPGGAGTAEEMLYLLGILLDPANRDQPLPRRAHRPRGKRRLFRAPEPLHRRHARRDGAEAPHRDHRRPCEAWRARSSRACSRCASSGRRAATPTISTGCSSVPEDFQHPFEVTHESMRASQLHRDQPVHQLAANLRRAFSGHRHRQRQGIRHQPRSKNSGRTSCRAIAQLMKLLDELLTAFVAQLRMKLARHHVQDRAIDWLRDPRCT